MALVKLYKYQSVQEAVSAYLLRLLRYLGITEGGMEHNEIVKAYNTLAGRPEGLPRGVKAALEYDWCAITVAGIAHAMGLTEAYPMEMSCSKIIEIAKSMGIWIEDDGYIPVPGDWCIFAWKGEEGKENTLAPNHIGAVYFSDGEVFLSVEGNKGDTVGTRALQVGDRRIRGFVHPDFAPCIGKSIAPSEPVVQPVEPVQPIYRRLEDVPEWGRAAVAKLVDRGWLKGVGEDDLALSDDLARVLTVLDRGQVFEAGVLSI